MKKILILTTGFGNGHNAAAFGLREAFGEMAPQAQVEVLDLFARAYGARGEWVKSAFLATVNHLPRLWACAYRMLDRSSVGDSFLHRLSTLRETLRRVLYASTPDAVISTYPAYPCILDQLYGNQPRPFQTLTVVTDSISVNSIWHRSPSDFYFVPNELTAAVLRRAGVAAARVVASGFPVSPWFYELAQTQLTPLIAGGEPKRVLYLTHQGRGTAGPAIERLAEMPDLELTIVCGAQPALEADLRRRTARAAGRVRVYGWTDRMPELLASSHLVITKAGGALVQEAIAARCPMLINRIIPGHEEGNAALVTALGIGAVAAGDEHLLVLVREAFANDAERWRRWKTVISRQSRPDAALRIAGTVLQKIAAPNLARGAVSTRSGSERALSLHDRALPIPGLG